MTQSAIVFAANSRTSPQELAQIDVSEELLAFIEFLGHALAEKWCRENSPNDVRTPDKQPEEKYPDA